jgi:hypothetical protein
MSDTFPNAHFSRFRTRRQQPSTFDGEHKHTPFTTRKFISHGNRVHELTGKELHTFQLGGDKQQDLVDVFTALDEDKPDNRFEPLFDNIRTGWHNGTTYNSWKEREHAVNVSNHKNSNAKGHERHIDHIYIGNICRDVIRVSDARVITNSSSEDIRKKLSSPCFCGALKRCKKAWSAKAKELCTCRHFGILGSDHFPIVANLIIL